MGLTADGRGLVRPTGRAPGLGYRVGAAGSGEVAVQDGGSSSPPSRRVMAVLAALSVLARAWARVWARNARHERDGSVPTLEEAAEQARDEWVRASAYFDQVVDPDLVDYATYSLRAAERKFVYLLKRARQEDSSHRHITPRRHIYRS